MIKRDRSGIKSWAKRPVPKVAVAWSDEESQAFYNGMPWRNCRAAFIASDPHHQFCAVQLSLGKHVKMKDVDHIIPVRMGGAQYHYGNLMSLSEVFHRRKSRMERDRSTPMVGFVETEHGLIPKNRDEIIQIIRKY